MTLKMIKSPKMNPEFDKKGADFGPKLPRFGPKTLILVKNDQNMFFTYRTDYLISENH